MKGGYSKWPMRPQKKLLLRDPLSEVTRKERRFLLGLSFISIVLTWTGRIPTKIPALGIELPRVDQDAIMWVMIILVSYALIGFVAYAVPDFMRWRVSKKLVRRQNFEERETIEATLEKLVKKKVATIAEEKIEIEKQSVPEWTPELVKGLEEKLRKEVEKELREVSTKYLNERLIPAFADIHTISSLSKVSWGRAVFDFLIPPIIGLYALYCLWIFKLPVTSFWCLNN